MTDQTGSTPTPPPAGPRKLVTDASATGRPRFLTPALQAQLAAEQETIAAEEQSGLPAEEAAVAGIPVPPSPEPAPQPAVEAAAPEPDPLQETAAAEEQAGFVSEQAVSAQPADGLEPRVADALEKIRLAQEELERAQQQAAATQQQAEVQPEPAVQPEPPAPVAETPAPEPVQAAAAPVAATPAPVFQTSPAPSATPAATPTPLATRPFAQQQAAAASPSPLAGGMGAAPPSSDEGGVPPAYAPKKKSNKAMYIILACIAVIGGGAIWYAYDAAQKKNEAAQLTTEMRKLGAELNRKANDLAVKNKTGMRFQYKYDEKEYGITVKPDRKQAEILMNAVRNNAVKRVQFWQAEAHVLSIMAALDPSIADMLIDDIRTKIKSYSNEQLETYAMLLSSQEDPALQAKLIKLSQDIGKTSASKQGTFYAMLRYGMTPADLKSAIALLPDAKLAPKAMDVIEYLLPKATDAQKQDVAREVLATLNSAPSDQRFSLLRVLAITGTPQATSRLLSMITNDVQESMVPLRAMQYFSNDSIVEPIVKLLESGKITNEQVWNGLYDRGIDQLIVEREGRTDEQGAKMFEYFVNKAEGQTDEKVRKLRKRQLVKTLGALRPHKYVTELLEKYRNDPDGDIQMEATAALNRIQERETERNKPKQSRQEKEDEINRIMQGISSPNE